MSALRENSSGEFEVELTREIPGFGTITFEQAPAGWITSSGVARKRDHRAYWFTREGKCPACQGHGRDFTASTKGRKCSECNGVGTPKRKRMTSVTSLIGQITPKDGLTYWAEARGIEGAVQAVRFGLIDPHDPASSENAVQEVRANRLGADAARDDAAKRGLNIHQILEDYMQHGTVANPADHDPDHHGYIRALSRWILATDPEMVAVEQMVCSPDDGYAGRLDLLARVRGKLGLFDLKTSEKGQVYPGAHLQLGLLRRAMLACGDEPPDFCRVVSVAADGAFREMDMLADDDLVWSAIDFAHRFRPVTSACESANKVEREARRAA